MTKKYVLQVIAKFLMNLEIPGIKDTMRTDNQLRSFQRRKRRITGTNFEIVGTWKRNKANETV